MNILTRLAALLRQRDPDPPARPLTALPDTDDDLSIPSIMASAAVEREVQRIIADAREAQP